MHKVMLFRATKIIYLGEILQALHMYFAEVMKQTEKNFHGISFPEINQKYTGTLIGVHYMEKIENLLTYKPLMKLMMESKVSFTHFLDLDLQQHTNFVAFIRDRRLERGAPPQAMRRMNCSNHDNKQQIAQAAMSRYFEQTLPHISMFSQSSKRNFSLSIATLHAIEAKNIGTAQFNSYGLSSYSAPVFLPVPELDKLC